MDNSKTELQAKIAETKNLIARGVDAHGFMKQVNKYYRKRGTCKGFPDMTEEKAKELDAIALNKSNCPFNSRELEKSNKDLGQLKIRLMNLQDQQAEGGDSSGNEAV